MDEPQANAGIIADLKGQLRWRTLSTLVLAAANLLLVWEVGQAAHARQLVEVEVEARVLKLVRSKPGFQSLCRETPVDDMRTAPAPTLNQGGDRL
jgi:hypothetical protein